MAVGRDHLSYSYVRHLAAAGHLPERFDAGVQRPQGQSKLDAWLDSTTASDDYDASLSILDNAPSFSALPGKCANGPDGTVVTFTVTDDCANSSTCTAIVYVLDTAPPVITCPDDITIECDESTDPSNTGSAPATDNCSPSPTVTFTDSQPNNSA